MTNGEQKRINLHLVLPAGLLILLIIVFITLILAGFKISQFLFYFFLLMGFFLVYQLVRQLFTEWRVKQAIKKIDEADALVEAGRAMEGIKLWKSLLFSLPQDHYLEVLNKMQETYQAENMVEGVEQVKAIHAESRKFFSMSKSAQRGSPKDKQDWRTQAYELRTMIKALPEE